MTTNDLRTRPNSFTMSSMIRRLNGLPDRGEINVLIVPLILITLFFIGAATFAVYAYSGMNDYKLNSDKKVAAAVTVAKEETSIEKDKQHAEADKQPLKTYTGPEQYGSLRISYPKTWSGYVVVGTSGNQPLDAYFQPGVVPAISDQASTFALRVQVVNQSYVTVANQYNNMVTNKTLTASAYALPKVPNVVGIRYEGVIDTSKKVSGSIIILPLRDKTLKLYTESPTYANDFNTNILPNLTFSP